MTAAPLAPAVAALMQAAAALPCAACGAVLGSAGYVTLLRHGTAAFANVLCAGCRKADTPCVVEPAPALARFLGDALPCRQCGEATGPGARWSTIVCVWGADDDTPYTSVRCLACTVARAPDEGDALDDGYVVPPYLGKPPAEAAALAAHLSALGFACHVCAHPVGHGPGTREGSVTVGFLPDGSAMTTAICTPCCVDTGAPDAVDRDRLEDLTIERRGGGGGAPS